MKEFKLYNFIKLNCIIILMLIIFVDGNYLNSLVLSLEEELVVEEVNVSTEGAGTKAELMQNVIVNDEDVVSNYVTNMNATTSNNWAWPTNSNYVITSGYGSRRGSKHQAIDISGTGYGSNIYAVNNGIVLLLGVDVLQGTSLVMVEVAIMLLLSIMLIIIIQFICILKV